MSCHPRYFFTKQGYFSRGAINNLLQRPWTVFKQVLEPTGKINALVKLAPRHIPPWIKVSAMPPLKNSPQKLGRLFEPVAIYFSRRRNK
jgi:hypothetical protein